MTNRESLCGGSFVFISVSKNPKKATQKGKNYESPEIFMKISGCFSENLRQRWINTTIKLSINAVQRSKKKALKIIMSYPKSKNGQPYLVMKNRKKLFFNLFIKKYGLNEEKAPKKYSIEDIKRRIFKTEFFKYFISEFDAIGTKEHNKLILESHFHRMIIIIRRVGISQKYELLSFYPK